MNFVCAYTGPPNECAVCGGWSDIAGPACSNDCADEWAARGARLAAEEEARRDADEAFGQEVDRLRRLGYNDQEIDKLLKDWA